MIGYLEGKLLSREGDGILLLANQVGYEVLLPVFVMNAFSGKQIGEEVSLHIYYQQTERQPKPVLIGFNHELEKAFFQLFISVEAIGPLKAARALTQPIGDVAAYIEAGDVDKLKTMKGIGNRTAQKIIATLKGKMGRFALVREAAEREPAVTEEVERQVIDVLVRQLGHKLTEARQLVNRAIQNNRAITTPEELFEEVYRVQRGM
ncbi:MAG: Holliday junction DNA helicase RuvA [Deltaproteobacteria bacterium]|nr:Holliday junction DNA helicase RuvA [Deltaproteobacteria bacterium]